MDAAAAIVARHPRVRASLVRRQRDYAGQGGLVMEGRDIGTVVFPDADVKVFLDASAEERARRRATDASHASSQGQEVSQVATALAERDRQDSTRKTSPLAMAPDAVRIDTTGMPIADVVEPYRDTVFIADAADFAQTSPEPPESELYTDILH